MCSTAVDESNRFHCRLVPSLTARRPNVRSPQPWLKPYWTRPVASKLTVPTPAHPLAELTAWLPGACAVCPPSHPGWLFQVVDDEMPPVTHTCAFDAVLQVHDHFCVISKLAER